MTKTTQIAVFGGGCFWCTEAVFKMLRGVTTVQPGYAGGTVPDPTYEQVCSGKTGHAEVIYIEYDPELVSYRTLLTIFFASHDPTTLNRQGADVGTQYRSVIFYTTPEQKADAEAVIKEIDTSHHDGDRVVTEVVPFEKFYEAEDYHKNYFAAHPGNPYCQVIINPKLQKIQKQYSELFAVL